MSSKTFADRVDATKHHAKLTANYGGVAVLVAATASYLIPGVDGAIDNGVVPVADFIGSTAAHVLQTVGALVADAFHAATAGLNK